MVATFREGGALTARFVELCVDPPPLDALESRFGRFSVFAVSLSVFAVSLSVFAVSLSVLAVSVLGRSPFEDDVVLDEVVALDEVVVTCVDFPPSPPLGSDRCVVADMGVAMRLVAGGAVGGAGGGTGVAERGAGGELSFAAGVGATRAGCTLVTEGELELPSDFPGGAPVVGELAVALPVGAA